MKRTLVCLLAIVAALSLAACGSGGDDYDPKEIAVEQPGDGPPPMARPGEPAPQ